MEDASAFQSLTKSEYASESPAVDSQKDESSSGRTDDGSNPDSHTAADESQTADTNAGRDLSETVTGEDADSAEAADDKSEDQEDVDKETSGTGDTDSESAEASNEDEEDPERDNEDEKSDVFNTYGSNDFSGTITPEIVRIPADEWAGFGESVDGFLEREKDFFEAGTSIFFDLKGTEYSANIQNDSFDIEKTEDGTAVAIETASIKDGSGVYENVVEYVIRNAGSTSDGEKVDLILTLDEARIELPEESREGISGKVAVSSVSNDHTFRAEARTIPASMDGNDADRENEAEAVDVKAKEKWYPASETCDRERVAMLSGFTGKALCCEDTSVSVSPSGYLEGNGQPGAVILPVNSANIQFAWGGTNCSTDIFADFSRIKSEEVPEKDKTNEEDPTDPDSTADAEINTNTEKASLADTEESMAESAGSRAAIMISHEEEPEKESGLSVGDTLELSMKVKNSGSELLKDVEVSEILDDDAELTVAWNRSSDPDTGENVLSEGETVPVTVTYTVTQDDIDTGKLVRKTEASAQTANRDAVEDDQTSEVILKGTASIDFSKKASVQQISDARAGAAIQYSFTVTNSGNVTLRDIEVIDQMEGLSRIEYDWEESTDSRTGEGYLSPGERVTAYATYEITTDDIQNGKIVNKAFARGKTMQGKTIESNEPEAPTSISPEGQSGKKSGSPETGDDTDIFIYLMPAIISFTILITSFVLGEIQRKKMAFDDEEKD